MLGLVVYARASRPSDGSGPPRLGDHWHAAYGFYVCDDTGAAFLPNLQGTLEDTTIDSAGNTVYADKDFRNTGIHSHGDGVIHYHPYTSQSTGTRARLGVFLDNYDVKLTDTKLEFPASQGGQKFDTVDLQVQRRGHPDPRAGVGELRRHGQLPRLRHRLQRTSASTATAWSSRSPSCRRARTSRSRRRRRSCPTLGTVDGGDAITVPSAAGSVDGTVAAGHQRCAVERRRARARRPSATPPWRRRPPPPPRRADARRRPRRWLRHPAAAADQQRAQADAARRPRADHRAAGRQPRPRRRHRGDARPRLPPGAVRRGVPRRDVRRRRRCATPSSRSRSTPPGRSASPPTRPASTTRSSWPTATSSPTSTSAHSSPSTAPTGPRRRSTSSPSTIRRRSAWSTLDDDGRVRALRREAAAGHGAEQPDQRRHLRARSVRAGRIPVGQKTSIERVTFPAIVADRRPVRDGHRRRVDRHRPSRAVPPGEPRRSSTVSRAPACTPIAERRRRCDDRALGRRPAGAVVAARAVDRAVRAAARRGDRCRTPSCATRW